MLIKINIYPQPSSLGLRGFLITREVQVAALFALGAFSEAGVIPRPANEDKRQVADWAAVAGR